MNVTNAPLSIVPIQALVPVSRRLFIEFDSQPELAVPLRSVRRLHGQPTEPDESTAPTTVLPVDAAPTPYSHWGINE
jgi:hypothetical protein